MLFRTFGAGLIGTDGFLVSCEADVEHGFPQISFIGSLSASVREASDRVRTAIANTGIRLDPRHVTINLSPADLKKYGCAYDLSIAAALLGAYGLLPSGPCDSSLLAGELSLSGRVLPVHGVISMVCAARDAGLKQCFLPMENLREGSVITGISCYGISALSELLDYLTGSRPLPAPAEYPDLPQNFDSLPDFSDVRGQEYAVRAALLAAAGRHNILLIGPAGTGKSMIASRLPSILPSMTLEEQLDLTRICSIAGLLDPEDPLVRQRPFRSPHHTITPQALSGGGVIPRPGEVTLASHGVLFLDELPEFRSQSLEILRQPMEENEIHLSRVSGTISYPASFQLVCAMNPCRCGFWPDRNRCRCTEAQVRSYIGRISKPLLDRIDICAETSSVSFQDLNAEGSSVSSAELREQVERTREVQAERFRSAGIRFNSEMDAEQVREYCALSEEDQVFLKEFYDRGMLSARGLHKILKVARTAADLSCSPDIRREDLCEAISCRSLENKYWDPVPAAGRIRRRYHEQRRS